MKSRFLNYFMAIAGLLILASCEAELEESSQKSHGGGADKTLLTINAGSPEVKTYMDNLTPYWYSGDKLGIFLGSIGSSATKVDATLTNSSSNGATASFTGTVSESSESRMVYAFYPARSFYATEDGSIVDMEIPYIQFPTTTSFDPKADLLVGVPKEYTIEGTSATISDMQFRRIGAIVKVVLTDNSSAGLSSDYIKSVKLESSTGYLSGVFRYDFANEDAASTNQMTTDSKMYVTADISKSPVALNGSNAVYLLVNPCTLASGSTLTVTVLTDNHEVVKTISLSSALALPSSTVTTLNISLTDACSITKVYFQDNFDWLYQYWDDVYTTAYEHAAVNVDPVGIGSNSGTYEQPNIWNKYSDSIGDDFTSRGYTDINPSPKVLYMQENYLKFGKNNNQSGIQLPAIESFGQVPVNATLSFDWCGHDARVSLAVLVNGVEVATIDKDEAFSWHTANVTLSNVISSSIITIQPDLESLSISGYYRWFIDNIKITNNPSSVKWTFPEPGDSWVSGTNYDVITPTGTYVYSDDSNGKIIVTRSSTSAPSTYEYASATNYGMDGYCINHNGMYENDYWLFELYNVDNAAGNYTIKFKHRASNAGAKYYLLEYSTDGTTWSTFGSTTTSSYQINGTGDTYEVTYSYLIEDANTVTEVDKSQQIAAFSGILRIRTRVCADVVVGLSQKIKGGGSNRLGGDAEISFSAT